MVVQSGQKCYWPLTIHSCLVTAKGVSAGGRGASRSRALTAPVIPKRQKETEKGLIQH